MLFNYSQYSKEERESLEFGFWRIGFRVWSLEIFTEYITLASEQEEEGKFRSILKKKGGFMVYIWGKKFFGKFLSLLKTYV